MIAYKSSSSAATDQNFNLTVPLPAGVTAGDFLLAHISYRQGTGNSSITAPAGWTPLRVDSTLPDSGGVSSWIFTRLADGSEPASYTFTFADFRQGAGGIVAYSGVKTADPIDSSTVSIALGTTAPSTAALNTIYTAPRLVWLLAARDNSGSDTATAPGSMTQRWRANPPSAPGCVSLLADEVFAGPGTIPARTGTLGPAADAATTLVILSPADENPNYAPTASAGPDQSTEIGSPITFDGSGSSDRNPDDTLTYAWTHLSGPNSTAQLSNAAVASPVFTPVAAGIDKFRLTVTDSANATASDDVTISTTPVGVRVSFASGLGTVVTVPLPTSAQVGDIAYLATATRPMRAPTVPGWSAIVEATQGSSSTDVSLYTFAKRLTNADLGSAVTATFDDQFGSEWTAHVVTVAGLHGGRLYNHDRATVPLASPHSFEPTIVGPPGPATYVYTVTAIDAAGETVPDQPVVVSGAPAVLTSSNYVRLQWQPSQPSHRATGYNVYGRSGGSQTLIATVNAPQNEVPDELYYVYYDRGTAAGSQTPPTQQPLDWVMDGLNDDGGGVLMPERLYSTYAGARLLMFVAAQPVTPNAGITVGDPAGVSVLTTTTSTPDAKLVLHSAMQTLAAPTAVVGTRLFTPSDYASMWSTVGLILRPTGANGSPTASAGFDQAAEIGTTVYLDASQSYDQDGGTVTSAWAQTAGPTVHLSSTTTTYPTFVMPAQAVTFRLSVTDDGGLTATDSVTITPIRTGRLKIQDSVGTWRPLP